MGRKKRKVQESKLVKKNETQRKEEIESKALKNLISLKNFTIKYIN
jgi:hypothetical protein